MAEKSIVPWVCIAIMALATGVLLLISKITVGSFLPNGPKESLLFQNALLLIVLGSALLEYMYTKPVDSVINSLMGFISLIGVYTIAPRTPWIIVVSYCGLIFILSISCVAVSSSPEIIGWKKRVAQFTYRPAVVLGKARVLYSIVFLSGLFFFYNIQDKTTLSLVLFWGVFLAIWPLRIPNLLSSLSKRERNTEIVGKIQRVDDPDILRVIFPANVKWDSKMPMICTLPDEKSFWVVPLYSQFQETELLATGILTKIKAVPDKKIPNSVTPPALTIPVPTKTEINDTLGGGVDSVLIGYVKEDSTIGAIKLETLSDSHCYEGMLVWTRIGAKTIYYQIVNGENQEESFSSDKHGYQIATAVQLGHLIQSQGFDKYNWLPPMNAPIFSNKEESELTKKVVLDDDFVLGCIPNTAVKVGGDFINNYNQHTAILGVTGAGKTELAFDLVRHSLKKGMKVICIDLTAQYKDRLVDLAPVDLSVSKGNAEKLAEKLFDVDSGKYGAGDEKKALKSFVEPMRGDIVERIRSFLEDDGASNLGIIRLEEISNTKATLWITELYMTCLLNYARENRGQCPKTLVVVEEAHTVMPETNTMGVGDFDSKGLVGKIAQIALQGRKFGVGLLVLAQRTATVSKTVLTQCNTIISFACYDDTSLNFLKNIYGSEYVKLIPNLPRLNAVAFGPWIRSQQPIVFEVPYDEEKASIE